jgi:hypothetical protein
MDHLNTQEKKPLQDIKPKQQEEEEENAEPSEESARTETTINGVF